MMPTSPMAKVTAVFALSKEACVTPSILPEKAPHKTEDKITRAKLIKQVTPLAKMILFIESERNDRKRDVL